MYQVLKIYRNDFSYPKLPRRDYKEISCRDTNTPLKHEYQHYINMFNIIIIIEMFFLTSGSGM